MHIANYIWWWIIWGHPTFLLDNQFWDPGCCWLCCRNSVPRSGTHLPLSKVEQGENQGRGLHTSSWKLLRIHSSLWNQWKLQVLSTSQDQVLYPCSWKRRGPDPPVSLSSWFFLVYFYRGQWSWKEGPAAEVGVGSGMHYLIGNTVLTFHLDLGWICVADRHEREGGTSC